MESSSTKHAADAASGGGKPARTHWRRRDPAATAVYVVHPTQFRTVVQQLTGAPSPPATHGNHQGGNGTGTATTVAAAGSNAAAAAQPRQHHAGGARRGEESSSRQRTLGQMHQECMAWANFDDY